MSNERGKKKRKQKPEIYVMTDIEADGKIPGVSSMLSFASAAFTMEKELVGIFERNLELLEGATPDKETMEWWQTTAKEAWERCRQNVVSPQVAMTEYVKWLKSLPGKCVFVGYPLAFDWMWVYWYLIRFAGESPFGISGACMKTYAWSLMQDEFRGVSKRRMPKHWFEPLPHTHVSIDDAIEQGVTFINILRESKKLEPIQGFKKLCAVPEPITTATAPKKENEQPVQPQVKKPLLNDNWYLYYTALSKAEFK